MEDRSQIADGLADVHCPLCRGRHSIKLTRYNAEGKGMPHPVYTHHAVCPVTGDPFGVLLATEDNQQLNDSVMRWLAEAQRAGRYMVAVWYLRGDRIMHEWLTNEFPIDDIPQAFQRTLNEIETGGPKVRKLKSVELPPKKSLFEVTKQAEEATQEDQGLRQEKAE